MSTGGTKVKPRVVNEPNNSQIKLDGDCLYLINAYLLITQTKLKKHFSKIASVPEQIIIFLYVNNFIV